MVRIIISVMTAGGYKCWVDVVVSRSMVASDSAGAGPDVVGAEVRFSLLELIGDQIPNPATRLRIASGLRFAERLGVCADGENLVTDVGSTGRRQRRRICDGASCNCGYYIWYNTN